MKLTITKFFGKTLDILSVWRITRYDVKYIKWKTKSYWFFLNNQSFWKRFVYNLLQSVYDNPVKKIYATRNQFKHFFEKSVRYISE